jgi:predicted nucleic acid-binding protein
VNYLLDTNIISEFISKTPNQRVVDYILTLDENTLFLSVITIGEIKSGIEKLDNGDKKKTLLHWLENDLLIRFKDRVVSVDISVMLKWAEIHQKSRKQGTPLPVMDSLIGATCKVNNMTLITRNEKDFKHIDIEIINPF